MGFLHPWFLLGLGAAAVPLLLHLRQRQEPPRIVFPAVRYLLDATREHEKKLRFRHWLLLLLRTGLIVALVLAAAGLSLPVRGVESHAPTALAILFDNSLSSGVIVGGTPRIEQLREAARRILGHATPGDVLWVIPADGVPRRGSPEELRALVDTLAPLPGRLDLGQGIELAAALVRDDARPGGIVVLTDLQATAVTPARAGVPVVVVAVDQPPVANRGITGLDLGPQPWGIGGGRLIVRVAGESGAAVPLRVQVGARPLRPALVAPRVPTTVTVPPLRPGWYEVHAAIDPDELRGDDERWAGVRVAPVAAADWSEAGRFVAAALEALQESGRIRSGHEVVVGALGGGASVVLPPADPARLGALDRALLARGSTWSFGPLVERAGSIDSNGWLGRAAVRKRQRLLSSGSGMTGVLATVDGEPWIVRSGDLVLVASRLEPEWTDLPLKADFVPFLDAVIGRFARGEVEVATGAAGASTLLPEEVTGVAQGTRRWRVEGGAGFTPPGSGVYWLLDGADTVGSLGVSTDPRESDLRSADAGAVERLWQGRVVGAAEAGRAAFALAARADLRGPLLWLALLAGLGELVVAGWGGDRRRG